MRRLNADREIDIAKCKADIRDLESQIGLQDQTAQNTKLRLEHLRVEKKAKLKFLASALLFNQMESYSAKASKLRGAWQGWANRLLCGKATLAAEDEIRELRTNGTRVQRRAGFVVLAHLVQHIHADFKRVALRAIKKAGGSAKR